MSNIVAIIPAKGKSTRVPKKNKRDFCFTNLVQIKIKQLKKVRQINEIIVDSDDQDIINIAKAEGVSFQTRPDDLSMTNSLWSDVFDYLIKPYTDEHILLSFVTTPFITPIIYSEMIKVYLNKLESNDSCLAVSKIQTHLLKSDGTPLNFQFGRAHKNSEDLDYFYELLAGAYLINTITAKHHKYHIGQNPQLFVLDKINAIDINVKDDWNLAEALLKGLGENYLYDTKSC
ncbi:MAG: hypothetical protein ABJF11_19725 [Reichenbachiella sp.]|uniref:acylneuraminate cytidylyltransferase family protein n=1 Tax=Reichenbachiella sp. TaxID=2184521 RepID=UPI003264E24E